MAPRMIILMWLVASSPAFAASEIDLLRAELDRLRADYETRIQALERRLAAAEARTTPTATATTASRPSANPESAFNPAVGAVLVGSYRSFDDEGEFSIPGFILDEEAGRGEEGFSLGESEFNLQANVDDKFHANATFALADEDGSTEVELEEAWIQSTALPHGLTLRAGRFFSDVGYLNQFHRHADDFTDRPLPYRAFFGNQYTDDGVRLSWIAPTDLFVELGAEWFRGAAYPAGGSDNQGKGAWTGFLHLGGDLGTSHSWRLGVSRVGADSRGRTTGEDENGDGGSTTFSGDTDLWIADLVWKWAPDGNPTERFLKFQAEYFARDEDGIFLNLDQPDLGADTTNVPYDADQSGWYAQAYYQFMPGWRIGARHAALSADDPGAAFAGTVLDRGRHTPKHDSLVLEWANSEFARLRLQFNRDRSSRDTDNQVVLQYIMSLGAHGAHKF